ncbi:DUF3139 domain-containing protein [Virgibacillus sp. SK37]|uniref:DUF3139 domain-containing protein n=1 Tax=Virgibacillus sp. SK37 TaxID=403957 RepID=UPI0004D0DE62|nr:DUF3139 domain-containing protein [Virgibacillus sp. SK37]AIF45059.1 hypothetical protein X953_00885 [Virgibacillus sp. SK37]
MKKLIFIILTIILIILGIIYLTLTPDQDQIHLTEDKVENYLLNQKNYKKSDIKSIIGNYNAKDVGNPAISAYTADVVFKDEPNVTYSYFIEQETDQVVQGGISSPKDNNFHAEE